MPVTATNPATVAEPLDPPEPRGYPGNLGLLFAAHAREHRTAIVDLYDPAQPRSVSFRALDQMCDAVARGLTRDGIGAGDRVGIVSLNRVEFVATLLGAMRAGVVPVPINIKLTADTVAFILKDAGAKLVFAEPALRRLCPDSVRIVDFGPDHDAFVNFLDRGSFAAFEPARDSVAVQPYTSGSTGRPKGVLLTHYGQNWSRRILVSTRRTTARDTILIAAPLYHKNALNAVKQGLTAGALLPLLPQFNVERYIDAIGRYHCTVISGVPTMMAMVLAQRQRLAATDVTSVRTVMMGSAPASTKLLNEVKQHFPNAEPLVVYGVTEGGPVPLGPHPDGRPRPPGSIGVPYAGTEA
ncbi:MAG TPA: class I adenylate-forming enzyme family protein, partial [Burkholderiales bacterium]|nr:class I adenylate-forming enzyme family protein [Burkholderiales bacterium]